MPYGGRINLNNTRLMATNSNVRIKFKKHSDTHAKERKRRLEFQSAQILNQAKLGANIGKEGVDQLGLHMSCRTKSTKEEKCYEENRGIQRYRFFMYNIPTNVRHERISDFLYNSILRFAHSSFDLRLFHQPADNPKYSSKFLGFALVDVKFWAKNKERWLNFPRYLEENIAGRSLVTGKFTKPSCFPDHDFSVIKKYLKEQVNTKIKDPSKHLHLSVGAVGPLVKKGYHISRLRLVTKPPGENELELLQELEAKPHLFYKNEAEKTTMEIQKFLNHRNEDGVMENLESKINQVEESPEAENKLRQFVETDKDLRFENRCVFKGLSPGCGHNQITIEIFRLTGIRLKKCYAFSNPTNWRRHLGCGYVETLTKKDVDKLLFMRKVLGFLIITVANKEITFTHDPDLTIATRMVQSHGFLLKFFNDNGYHRIWTSDYAYRGFKRRLTNLHKSLEYYFWFEPETIYRAVSKIYLDPRHEGITGEPIKTENLESEDESKAKPMLVNTNYKKFLTENVDYFRRAPLIDDTKNLSHELSSVDYSGLESIKDKNSIIAIFQLFGPVEEVVKIDLENGTGTIQFVRCRDAARCLIRMQKQQEEGLKNEFYIEEYPWLNNLIVTKSDHKRELPNWVISKIKNPIPETFCAWLCAHKYKRSPFTPFKVWARGFGPNDHIDKLDEIEELFSLCGEVLPQQITSRVPLGANQENRNSAGLVITFATGYECLQAIHCLYGMNIHGGRILVSLNPDQHSIEKYLHATPEFEPEEFLFEDIELDHLNLSELKDPLTDIIRSADINRGSKAVDIVNDLSSSQTNIIHTPNYIEEGSAKKRSEFLRQVAGFSERNEELFEQKKAQEAALGLNDGGLDNLYDEDEGKFEKSQAEYKRENRANYLHKRQASYLEKKFGKNHGKGEYMPIQGYANFADEYIEYTNKKAREERKKADLALKNGGLVSQVAIALQDEEELERREKAKLLMNQPINAAYQSLKSFTNNPNFSNADLPGSIEPKNVARKFNTHHGYEKIVTTNWETGEVDWAGVESKLQKAELMSKNRMFSFVDGHTPDASIPGSSRPSKRSKY